MNPVVGYTQLCHFLKVLHHKMDKMKIFLASRVLGRFEPYFAPFAHTRKFQITRLLSITYLKKWPSPTSLQRLPW